MTARVLGLGRKRLVAVLGPGGVGKTTLSAALAIELAARGRAVSVLTVDPAPRLLDALGLPADSSAPQEVALDGIVRAARRGTRPARLTAMRLDAKHTFDSIVRRYAPSEAAADAIVENRIYRNLSSALSGVGDYMAMEKLVELDADRATDTIVLDTPPARDALDFLGAPSRILELLDSRAVELLSAPSGLVRSGLGLVDWGARAVLSAFDRATGINLLPDIQAFVRSFDGMYPGFAERARRAWKLMTSDAAALVLVTTPEEARVEQACEFLAALRADGLAVKGVVVNRVLAPLPDEGALRSARISAPLRRKLRRNLREFAALKERESQNLARLRGALPAPARLAVAPDLGREPRTLQELAELARRVREA